MPQIFHVVRCCDCATFQVQQVKKVKKWSCKVCGQKQSLIKEYGSGSGADCRQHVQKLNSLRQEMDIKEFDKNLAVICDQEQEQHQQYHYQQQLQNIEDDATGSRWQKFLGSHPQTESSIEEKDDIFDSIDQFDVGNFQSKKKRPKWSVSKANSYKKTISKDPDVFADDHILPLRRESSFLNAENHHLPSQQNTSYWKMRKHHNMKDNTFTDDSHFTDIQFPSESGHHRENVLKSASYVTASNYPMPTAPTVAIPTAASTSAIKHNRVMSSLSKNRRPSLHDHSSSKANAALSTLNQKSQIVSDKVVHSTSSNSSKWSHFLSNTNQSEDTVGDSNDDYDDIGSGDGDGGGCVSGWDVDCSAESVGGWDIGGGSAEGGSGWDIGGSDGGVNETDDVGDRGSGINGGGGGANDGGVKSGCVAGWVKNPSLVKQFKAYEKSQHKIHTNRGSLLHTKNNDVPFKTRHLEEFSHQSLPLTPDCQNSAVTSVTVTPKDLTDIEHIFNLDENEFDFNF